MCPLKNVLKGGGAVSQTERVIPADLGVVWATNDGPSVLRSARRAFTVMGPAPLDPGYVELRHDGLAIVAWQACALLQYGAPYDHAGIHCTEVLREEDGPATR